MATVTHRHRKVHKVLRVTGGRVAYTNTSRIPDRDVELALRALAKELCIDNVVVHMKHTGRRSRRAGYAYRMVPWGIMNTEGLADRRWRYLVVASDCGGPTEWLDTLAHEAKHTDHYRNGQYRRGTRKRPRARGCEAACDAFAAWWVNLYLEAPQGATPTEEVA